MKEHIDSWRGYFWVETYWESYKDLYYRMWAEVYQLTTT